MKQMNTLTWEFDLDLPASARWFSFYVQGKRRNKTGNRCGGAIPADLNGPDRHMHVVIVAYPLGESWLDAEKMIVITDIGPAISKCEPDNPFFGAVSLLTDCPQQEPDGRFCLMSGAKHPRALYGDASKNDGSLIAEFYADDGTAPPSHRERGRPLHSSSGGGDGNPAAPSP
jgi:hypothetical protein